ncbi:MAG: DUF4976 domain-containing protein, partial [Caldilineaceae bacterium]|nr:DUF4976 domain-containing protein [Caldilineaceae bacterium]
HYGIRTLQHKLIYYYADALGQAGTIDERYEPEWELFDLEADRFELNNLIHDPAHATTIAQLKVQLHQMQADLGDERYYRDVD